MIEEHNEDLSQDEIDDIYREALRATCSLCILEGRCLCGELDPLEEDEDEYDYNTTNEEDDYEE